MGHLYRFRKGWQSEHFAKYVLSKFSFIAEPLTVSDDLGSDFFCTLFKIIKRDELLPQNSFAIQIKSKEDMDRKKNRFEVTNKTQYLANLEIPFLVGVVDKNLLKITIYSGECISNFFTHKGNPSNTNKIFIELVGNRTSYPFYDFRYRRYTLKFPKILEIKADFDYIKNAKQLNELINVCRLTQANISTRKNGEHVYQRYSEPWVDIYAGPGSAKSFRENFLKRLTEVFYNLEWLHNDTKDEDKPKIATEFESYKKFYVDLQRTNDSLPPFLTSCFDRLNELINNE